MEFRRIPGLPPYVFTIIDGLKKEDHHPVPFRNDRRERPYSLSHPYY